MSEPGAGSAGTDLKAELRPDGDGFRLHGTKCWITGGREADTIVVFCRAPGSSGPRGIGAVLVNRGLDGVDEALVDPKMGFRGVAEATIHFDGAFIDPADVLIRPDTSSKRGASILVDQFNPERCGNAAMTTGVAQAALDDSVAHVKQRLQFGRSLSSFQGIQWTLADMALDVEVARLLTWRAARSASATGFPDQRATVMAKLHASEMVQRVTNNALQLHGARATAALADRAVLPRQSRPDARRRHVADHAQPPRRPRPRRTAQPARMSERSEHADFAAWAEATLPAEWVAAVARGDGPGLEAIATGPAADEAIRRAADAGWLTPDWPERYGGRQLDAAAAAAVKRDLRRWRVGDVRTAIGTAWIGPTILQWGTDEQRDRWLPPIAAAAELWCQLFSEPEAGSDLAALRTAARRHDDGTWRIDGRKMWTSRANISRRGLLIARSDSAVPKHRGIGGVRHRHGRTRRDDLADPADDRRCRVLRGGVRRPRARRRRPSRPARRRVGRVPDGAVVRAHRRLRRRRRPARFGGRAQRRRADRPPRRPPRRPGARRGDRGVGSTRS